MADEKIKIDVVTAYDDKQAKKALTDAEKLDKFEPEIEITADDEASKYIKAVHELAEQLDKADAEVVLRAKADAAKADLKAVQGQLADLEGKVIAPKIDIDTATARKGIDDVGASAESSKNILANMVGNSTSELGALGGVAGTAGTAIGQIGEYATEALAGGEKLSSVLTSMGKVAGPIALVTVAVNGIAGAAKKVAELKAWDRKKVDDYTEAMVEGATAAKALEENLREAGKVELRMGDLAKFDVTEGIVNAGLSVKQFAEITAGGKERIDAWAAAQKAAGVSTDTYRVALAAMTQEAGRLEEAGDAAAVTTKFMGTTAEDAAESQDRMRTAVERNATKVRDQKQAVKELREEIYNATTATDGYERAEIDLANAVDDSKAAHESAWYAVDDATTAVNEKAAADRAARVADLDLAAQVQATAERFAEQHGAVASSSEGMRLQRLALDDLKAKFPELAPFIDMHIAKLNAIPREIVTRTRFDSGAVIERRQGPASGPQAMIPAGVGGAVNVTINMPAGSRGVDVLRQVAGQARRSGHRYGTAAVHYARR